MNNPYSAPSQTDNYVDSQSSELGIVQGPLLIAKNGFVFPRKCVSCGEDCSSNMKKKKLYYAPVWVWFFILLNWIILAIIYFIVRKPIEITFGYCDVHVAKKKRYGFIALMSLVLGIASIFCGTGLGMPLIGIFFPFLLIAALVFFVLWNRTIVISGHKNGEFTIKGINQMVLDEISLKK